MTLRDLITLCNRYVPEVSRHPGSVPLRDNDPWWAAHEIGHLLTVPRRMIGEPMFGLESGLRPTHPDFPRCAAYELAAMSVSEQLLTAIGRANLYAAEIRGTDSDVLAYGSRSRARQILRRKRCLRVPTTREALERKIRGVIDR